MQQAVAKAPNVALLYPSLPDRGVKTQTYGVDVSSKDGIINPIRTGIKLIRELLVDN